MKLDKKIAIVGSRTFDDYDRMKNFIDNILKEENINPILIISGGAKGADSLGERYADENSIDKYIIYAEWKKYGRSAGFKRNIDIINSCDICIAFWDGKSHGTKHDIDLCKKYNKPCYICQF